MTSQVSKFGNIRTAYAGRMFSSKKEAAHAATLDLMRRAKDLKERVVHVEYQYPIPIKIGMILVTTYVADFLVTFADGRKEVQDTKGFRTDIYKLKKKLVKAVHGIDIIEN